MQLCLNLRINPYKIRVFLTNEKKLKKMQKKCSLFFLFVYNIVCSKRGETLVKTTKKQFLTKKVKKVKKSVDTNF